MTLALIINLAAVIALLLLLTATMRLPYRLPVARAATRQRRCPAPARAAPRVVVPATFTRRGPHPELS